jgi:hypothetical protein
MTPQDGRVHMTTGTLIRRSAPNVTPGDHVAGFLDTTGLGEG